MRDFFEKNKFLPGALVLLFWSVLINAFPEGYVFSGGDTAQFIEGKENFRSLFFDWQGRASIFYSLFWVLDSLGASASVQASWYLGIFLPGSFFSFYFFSGKIFSEGSSEKKVLASLFYSCNLFTLFVFTGNWGYSHYLTLYIFLPALFGLLIRFLESGKKTYGAFFCLLLFLASSGFANPAFFISFFFFCLFLSGGLFFLGKAGAFKSFAKNLSFLAIFSFLVSAYWIWPLIPQMNSGVQSLFSGNALDLNFWLSKTSSRLIDVFRLFHYSEDYFPHNFPYPSIFFGRKFFHLLALLPIFLIAWGVLKNKNFSEKNRRYFFLFLGMTAVFIPLVVRVGFPFETINHFLYNTWGLNTLRGWEKTAVFLPFLFSTLLLIVFLEMKSKKVFWILGFFLLLLPLPFWTGKFQQNMSYRFSGSSPEKKDFQKSNLSFLVKIPEEYRRIQERLNSDPEDFFVATLPYNYGETGSGVSHYPKWKFLGVDITQKLYRKKLIEANFQYFPDWLFSYDFSEEDLDPAWAVELLGVMNARYVLYHTDVAPDFVRKTKDKMAELEKRSFLKVIERNDFFTLYEIREDFLVPYVAFQEENFSIDRKSALAGEIFSRIRNASEEASYRKINPKKIEVSGKDLSEKNQLALSEAFDPNWQATVFFRDGGKQKLESHFPARGYANGWDIPKEREISKIEIDYRPIKLLFWGGAVSLLTILFLSGYLLKYGYVKK